MTLAELRDEFDGKLAILSAYLKQIDRAVLAGGSADMAEESPRDRLFDVLMRRIDAMTPYRRRSAPCCARQRAIPALHWRSTASPCAPSNGCSQQPAFRLQVRRVC